MHAHHIDRRRFALFAALGLGLLPRNALSEDGSTAELTNKFIDWQELAKQGQVFEHWTPEEDSHWTWFRLERFTEERWQSVGRSVPINKESGDAYSPAEGYLPETRIPDFVKTGSLPTLSKAAKSEMAPSLYDPNAEPRAPDADIRSRDGRPASDWLRSLYADELRAWLTESDAPEAGVSGMTFWVHLVRDHGFDPRRINGLSEEEFKQLHSAAHYGY